MPIAAPTERHAALAAHGVTAVKVLRRALQGAAHFGLLIAAVAALRAAIADPRGGDAAAVTAAELLGVTAPHVCGRAQQNPEQQRPCSHGPERDMEPGTAIRSGI